MERGCDTCLYHGKPSKNDGDLAPCMRHPPVLLENTMLQSASVKKGIGHETMHGWTVYPIVRLSIQVCGEWKPKRDPRRSFREILRQRQG